MSNNMKKVLKIILAPHIAILVVFIIEIGAFIASEENTKMEFKGNFITGEISTSLSKTKEIQK